MLRTRRNHLEESLREGSGGEEDIAVRVRRHCLGLKILFISQGEKKHGPPAV